jgi:cell division protein FtsZ
MKDAGYAHMGVGRASGKDKAEEAAKMAISSPLLETSINGAKGVIINITSSPDIGLDEMEAASTMISKQAHEDANIIWGAAFDEDMDDEMSVTVIATGFPTGEADETEPKQVITAGKAEPSVSQKTVKPAEKKEIPPEDDDFTDIMQIFSRKT